MNDQLPVSCAPDASSLSDRVIGPILYLDDVGPDGPRLAALFIAPKGRDLPDVHAPQGQVPLREISRYRDRAIMRARFSLPWGQGRYHWNGQDFTVDLDPSGDMRLAFVSCNGEETGDLDREGSERNVMWSRLREEHRRTPFGILLHGGDQVYADEITEGHPLTAEWPGSIPSDPSENDLASLHEHLREAFLQRYAALYAAPEFAWIAARVPSLMQWDDHDICDGWGSLPDEVTHSRVGRVLFSCAREAFMIFQAAAVEGDLPARFADPAGLHLGWELRLPGLRLLAPDLRSERGRRQIMGPGGWALMDRQEPLGPNEACFLLSSVPLLGPRLSLLETLMVVAPGMQKYEDDLRDQWQSHAHRAEWRRMLQLMIRLGGHGGNVTVVSGEIHLATRAVMPLDGGGQLHQLVASGIAHRPPPRGWARFLGLLASLGDDPVPGHHISIRRIPGQSARYVAERNYLVLARGRGKWDASWELEHGGRSPALSLGR